MVHNTTRDTNSLQLSSGKQMTASYNDEHKIACLSTEQITHIRISPNIHINSENVPYNGNVFAT